MILILKKKFFKFLIKFFQLSKIEKTEIRFVSLGKNVVDREFGSFHA